MIVTAGGIDCAHPFHLSAADRRGADVRRHDDDRRRHRPGDRHLRDDLHAGPVAHPPHAPGGRRLADEPRLPRQGQREPRAAAARADRGRRHRAQAARGLGHDAGGDRHCLAVADEIRRAGRDPHRHAERIGLRRDHARRVQGPHDPHLPHRGRGRRPCAGHHQGLRRAQRAAVVDQSDAAVHGQHHRRASRHADGLPPPRRRRSPRTSRSPNRASAARPSPPRTSCTTSARSR